MMSLRIEMSVVLTFRGDERIACYAYNSIYHPWPKFGQECKSRNTKAGTRQQRRGGSIIAASNPSFFLELGVAFSQKNKAEDAMPKFASLNRIWRSCTCVWKRGLNGNWDPWKIAMKKRKEGTEGCDVSHRTQKQFISLVKCSKRAETFASMTFSLGKNINNMSFS